MRKSGVRERSNKSDAKAEKGKRENKRISPPSDCKKMRGQCVKGRQLAMVGKDVLSGISWGEANK